MYNAVEKWRAYVAAYRLAPGDYTAQDGYMVEALEELLAEIDLLEEYKWMYEGLT